MLLKKKSVAFVPEYSGMEQVKFTEDNPYKIWSNIVCLNRPIASNFLKAVFVTFLCCIIF